MLQEMKLNDLRETLRDAPHFPTGITLKCVVCDNAAECFQHRQLCAAQYNSSVQKRFCSMKTLKLLNNVFSDTILSENVK